MAEYIEREVVRNAIKALCEKYNQAYGGNYGGFGEELAKSIDNMSAADVEPVRRGHWIINSDGYYPQCSECMKEPQGRVMTDWCPNCGAKMKGEENGRY